MFGKGCQLLRFIVTNTKKKKNTKRSKCFVYHGKNGNVNVVFLCDICKVKTKDEFGNSFKEHVYNEWMENEKKKHEKCMLI